MEIIFKYDIKKYVKYVIFQQHCNQRLGSCIRRYGARALHHKQILGIDSSRLMNPLPPSTTSIA